MKGLAHFLNFEFYRPYDILLDKWYYIFKNIFIILVLQISVSSRPKDLFPPRQA